MKMRSLGSQGLRVAELGLGCMGLSDFYFTSRVSEPQAVSLIHRALDLGVSMLDTADVYGPHTNEIAVGKALAGRRAGVIVASKFGLVRAQGGATRGVNGHPEYVRAACEASLARLGLETIDLYYQHRVEPQVPIEETVGAMARLVSAGKVRFLGLSEASPATLRRAHAVHPISALQTEYSLWSREPEDAVLPTARELGIGFVAYSPLGRGFLTGRFRRLEDLASDDYRRSSPRFQGENFQKNLDVLAHIDALAARKGCTPAQLALAWLLARGPDVVPIPGTTDERRLAENLAAADVVVGAEDLRRIEELAPQDFAAGHRYPPQTRGLLNG